MRNPRAVVLHRIETGTAATGTQIRSEVDTLKPYGFPFSKRARELTRGAQDRTSHEPVETKAPFRVRADHVLFFNATLPSCEILGNPLRRGRRWGTVHQPL